MKTLLIACVIMASVSCFAQKDIPVPVKESFTKNFPGVTVKKWGKEDGNYEANFTKEGKSMSATFDAKGEWLETEIDIEISELPAAVTAYVKEHCKGAAIKEAAKLTTPKGDMYEAEVKGKDLLFDMSGKFIKEEED